MNELTEQKKEITRQGRSGGPKMGHWLIMLALVLVVVLAYGNFRHTVTAEGGLTESEFDTAGLTSILINGRNTRVEVTRADVAGVQLSLSGAVSGDQLHVSRDGDGLNVNVNRAWWRFLTFNQTLEVLLPDDYEQELIVTSSSGGIQLDDLQLGNIITTSSSGRTGMEDVQVTGDLKIISSSGRVFLDDVNVAGRLELTSSSGSVELTDAGADSYSFRTSSGTLQATGLTGNSLTSRTSSGRVSLSAAGLIQDWDLESSSGSVTVSFEQTPGDFTLDFAGSSGVMRVADRYGLDVAGRSSGKVVASVGAGGPQLRVRTSSGGFNLE